MDTIKNHGIIQPLVITPKSVDDGATGRYSLVCGLRRYLAARAVGVEAVPALIALGRTDEISIIENVQRTDLLPFEEAEALDTFRTKHGYTQKEVGRMIGKSSPWVSEILSILRLPESIIDECRKDSTIPRRTLVQIARLTDTDDMLRAFERYKKGDPLKKTIEKPAKSIKHSRKVSIGYLNSFHTALKKCDIALIEAKNRVRIVSELQNIRSRVEEMLNVLDG